jgi:hypothetical protein
MAIKDLIIIFGGSCKGIVEDLNLYKCDKFFKRKIKLSFQLIFFIS